jgi:hypothetical protein
LVRILCAKLGVVTAKDLLLLEAPTWSEEQAERALRAAHAEPEEAAKPGDIVDDWGNLSAMKRRSARRTMRRLTQEEADAGLEPW